MPRFSVLLPTHNRADVIGVAIQSVLDQTEPDFELLIAGDGCTDNTASVVTSFADPRIRWFDLPKAPFFGYANRNAALSAATGDHVAYIAHDDLLLPDHLEQVGRVLDHTPADWAFTRPVWVSQQGAVISYPLTFAHEDEVRAFMTEGNTIPMSCIAHRRSWLLRVGGWPEDMATCADWELWKRMLAAGGVPASCRVPTALHFVADWRRPHGVGPPEAAALLARAGEAWWPKVLLVAPSAGETEQHAMARQLRRDGADWCRALRAGLDTVTDRLAWEQVGHLTGRPSNRTLAGKTMRPWP
jgi:glycosyltransferase involved in cell wall biosynthesis